MLVSTGNKMSPNCVNHADCRHTVCNRNHKRSPSQRYKHWEYFLPLQCITTVTTDVAAQSHLMILLQAPQSGVLPLSSGACCAACRMELRFCIGVGWAGCWCWVTTVLVLSGRKRSAKLGSVTHGGRLDGPELSAAAASAAVLEPEPGKKNKGGDLFWNCST